MERSLSKKSRVVQEYVEKKADFPTAYYGPDNKTLSSLPDYGKSNAALPRGEDPSVLPYPQIQATETIMSNRKQELAKIASEIKTIRSQLDKQSREKYDWSYIKKQSEKVDWYDVKEDDEELQLGYYGPGGGDYPDVSAYIYLGNRSNPEGFYVEVSLNEVVGEQYPMLAKKLSKVKGVDYDGPWSVTFDVDREDFLFEILSDMAQIMDEEM